MAKWMVSARLLHPGFGKVATEDVSVLQMSVDQYNHRHHHQQSQHSHNANNILTRIVGSGNLSDSEIMELVLDLPNVTDWKGLADQVTTLMHSSLMGGHEADVHASSQFVTDYDSCGSQFNLTQLSVDSLTMSVADQSVLHQVCRIDEQTADGEEKGACDAFSNFKLTDWNQPLAPIVVPGGADDACAEHSSLWTTQGKSSAGEFVEKNQDFVAWKVKTLNHYLEHYQNCTMHGEAATTKATACLEAQGQLELDSCALYTLKTSQCVTHSLCFGNVEAAADTECPSMQTRQDSRKEFCALSLDITCVLRNVVAEVEVGNSIASAVEACRGKEAHTLECEKYDVLCPATPTPPPPPCNVPSRPGEPAWWNTMLAPPSSLLYQFNGTQLDAAHVHLASSDVLQCPEMGGPGNMTVAPTPAPAPTTPVWPTLQGRWVDDFGYSIYVSGQQAVFTDPEGNFFECPICHQEPSKNLDLKNLVKADRDEILWHFYGMIVRWLRP